jgi:hypothetical protein
VRPVLKLTDTITASYLQDGLPGIHSLQMGIFDGGGHGVPLCQVQTKHSFTVWLIKGHKREAEDTARTAMIYSSLAQGECAFRGSKY